MAKQTFKNATIDFGGVEYFCLGDLTLDTSVSVSTAECSTATGNATTYNAIGAETATVSATFTHEDDQIALDQAFAAGTSGALIVYPYGNITGKASYAWDNAFVSTWGLSGATSTIGTAPVSLVCDGIMTPALVTA